MSALAIIYVYADCRYRYEEMLYFYEAHESFVLTFKMINDENCRFGTSCRFRMYQHVATLLLIDLCARYMIDRYTHIT